MQFKKGVFFVVLDAVKLFFLKTLLDCVVVLGFAFFFFGMIRCVGNLQWEEVLMFILVTRF